MGFRQVSKEVEEYLRGVVYMNNPSSPCFVRRSDGNIAYSTLVIKLGASRKDGWCGGKEQVRTGRGRGDQHVALRLLPETRDKLSMKCY